LTHHNCVQIFERTTGLQKPNKLLPTELLSSSGKY
jgi:hypothetical protein